jgi:hypothetical protein
MKQNEMKRASAGNKRGSELTAKNMAGNEKASRSLRTAGFFLRLALAVPFRLKEAG